MASFVMRRLRAGQRLARSRIALWILGAAALLALTAVTGIAAIDSLLGSMHGSGDVSAGLQSGLSRSPKDIAAVVQGWSNFADLDADEQYWSPLALGFVSLLLDSAVLVPGYLVAGTIMLLRGAQWNAGVQATRSQAARRARQLTRNDDPDQPAVTPERQATLDAAMFRRRLQWAFLALLVLVVVDLAENLLSAGVLLGYWPQARGQPVDPPGWAGLLSWALRVATFVKWALVAWVVTELLLLAIRYLNARWNPAIATLRLLRAQIVIVIVLLLVLQLPVQVPDAVLRLQVGHFLGVAVVTVGLATLQWAICRHLLLRAADRRSRDLNPTQRAPRWWWSAGFGAGLLLVGLVALQIASKADVNLGDLRGEILSGPGVLLALLAVIAVGTRLTRDRPQKRLIGDDPETVLGRGSLPRLLGVAVPVAVGLAVVRHTAAALAYRDNASEWTRLAGGVGLVLLAFALAVVFSRLDGQLRDKETTTSSWRRGPHLNVAFISALVTVALATVMVRFWATWPEYVGALGVVLVFLAAVSAFTAVLVGASEWASTRYKPPSLFRAIGLRRWPVFTLLLIWFVAGARFDSGVHWDVRRLEDAAAPQARITLTKAWEGWRDARAGQAVAPGADRPVVPLVLVAASGGGIRAATWTALAMRCVFEGQPARRDGADTACVAGDPASPARTGSILLASGISGSSLGLAALSAHLDSKDDTTKDWVDRLKGDYVSSQLAWQLLVEVPRSLLHFRAQDRAEVIERSWEQGWDGVQATGGGNPLAQGLLATQLAAGRAGRIPLLLLNGDSVYDGCWLLSSALDEGLRSYPKPADETTKALERPVDCHNLDPYTANRRFHDRGNEPSLQWLPAGSLPGAVDTADFLCSNDGRAKQDLRLSTAALLSARFPEVSPAGRLQFCDKRRPGSPARNKFVLDGGIIEGSASEAALAAWERLRPLVEAHNADADRPCIAPFFVQLDNDYLISSSETSPRPPNQLRAPLQAQSAAGTGSRAQRIRQATALAFTGASIGPVEIKRADGEPLVNRYERLVPLGHPGPQASLGWALSTQTQRDLENQLHRENKAGIDTIRGWLTNKLTCTEIPR